MARQITETTNKFLEVSDPRMAVGLWSHRVCRTTGLTPVGNTKYALGRFLNDDIVRWETRHEMCKAMTEIRKKLSPVQKMKVYAEVYPRSIDAPPWYRAWRRYTPRLHYPAAVAALDDVQMFFNAPSSGVNCHELNLHSGRTFFLRRNGRHFVAVVLKPGGTKWWTQIDHTNVTWTDNVYDRLIIDPRGRLEWSPILAEVIDERVAEKDICLFAMDDDPVFRAVTDNRLNPDEKYAHLSYNFDFFCRNPEGGNPAFYLKWSALFNPSRARYQACDRQGTRLVEVMRERRKDWIERQLEVVRCVSRPEDLDAYAERVARWVVEQNGCAVLPSDPPDEIRLAVSRALFYVTFPDRKPDAVGGILRGYQLPGRIVERATGIIRAQTKEKIVEKSKTRAEEAIARRRALVVDTLLGRAASVVAARNGLDADEARRRIESVGGRAVLEKAAWAWGFMEGNAIKLFKPTPTAGNLKLPDLSLALCFEHRLGLEGGRSAPGRLVQTARMRTLAEAQGAIRASISGAYRCRSVWTPQPGKKRERIAYTSNTVRILRDDDRFYLMAVPKYSVYQYGRDLAYDDAPGKPRSVSVKAYGFKSEDGSRSRADTFVTEETFDFNKVMKLAREGRIYLYSIDFGADKWLADITYTTANERPCRIVPTVPILAPVGVGKDEALIGSRKSGTKMETTLLVGNEEADLHVGFIVNPTVSRDLRKMQGRSWKSYCGAYPDDANHPVVRFGDGNDSPLELQDAFRRLISTDGILMTDREHLDAVLRAAAYVVTDSPYRGYNLQDRVFLDIDGRAAWRQEKGMDGSEENAKRRQYDKDRRAGQLGKPICEIVQPATAAELECEWAKLIEGDVLADKKTAKFFKLEKPIVIGKKYAALVAREFRRVIFTGTMKYQQQLVRPAHEVALGIWLARMEIVGTVRDDTPAAGR